MRQHPSILWLEARILELEHTLGEVAREHPRSACGECQSLARVALRGDWTHEYLDEARNR